MLTVLFATYNGSKTLKTVLDAYCRLEAPQGNWKLVIADNGSTDSTPSIIANFKDALPLTSIVESKRGKNAALNSGLRLVEGDLLVLTDDDVLPHPDWLVQYRKASISHPEYAIFGGPILPEWERPPEAWLTSWVPMGPVFAVLDHIADSGPVENYLVYGPNMAIRTEIFQEGFRFDESIGPKGKNYAQGSETQLLRRLGDAGYRAWHCRDAVVRHMIRSSQMDKEWVLSRAVRYGRGQHRLGADALTGGARLRGVPLRMILRILKRTVVAGLARLGKDERRAFESRWRLNYDIGRAAEACYMHGPPPPKPRSNGNEFQGNSYL